MSRIRLTEQADPSTPPANTAEIFVSAGAPGNLKVKKDDGTVVDLEAGGGVTDHGALTGLGDDDHTQYQLRTEKNAASGYPGLDGSSKLTGSQQVYGSGANTACQGNDARLSDARAPTAHATSHQPGGGDAMAVDAAAATGSLRTLGTSGTSACAGNDARLSDARTPTAHATSHQPGGGDAMAVDAAAATGSLRTLGTASTAACAGNDARLSDARAPLAHATSHQAGGGDGIKLDDLVAPDDNTDLNATTGVHGLLPKLGGGTTNFLRADGAWAAPPGAGGGEANTASNVGVGGVGPFNAKVGVDLQFRNINVVSGSRLTVALDDPNDEIDLDIPTNAIDDTRLRDSAGFSVIGKASTGTGDPADITAADETVLGRTGAGNLAFAQVATGQIAAGAVTYAKIQDVSATDRLLGRATAGAGDVEEITCTAAGRAILDDADAAAQRTTLGAAASSHTHTLADITDEGALASLNTVGSSQIDNDAVTYAKLQNVAGFSVVGKASTGSGDGADITAADETVLGRTGAGNLAFAQVATGQVANDAITYAKIQTVTDARLLGRSAGSNGDCQEITVGSGLSLSGGALTATGGGGGDVVTVNGSAVTDADFDDATPAAPAGGSNVKWQTSGSGPADVSAYLDWGAVMNGFRRKPFFYTDFLEASTSTTLSQPPWARSATSGTMAAVAGDGQHDGILRIIAAAGANTGGAITSAATAILLAGGEQFEAIIKIDTLTNTTIRLGFLDSSSGAPIDGAWIEIPSTGAAVGKTSSNSTVTTSSTIATLSTATWYRCRVDVNSGATSVAFTIWTDDGTQQGTQSNTTNIPTAAGREVGSGISCLSQSSVNIAQLDWMAVWFEDRALTR